MFVILDTTEFFDSPLADSNSFKVLQAYIQRTQSQLVVPQVVFKEVLNHANERLFSVRSDLGKATREYERVRTVGADALVVNQPDFARSIRAYEATLQRTLERSFNAMFLPVPTVTHEAVLERAIQRKLPFRGKKGYRDTLIWLSIASQVREHPGEYVFITNNSNDFSGPELLAELGVLPNGSFVRFEEDLQSFTRNYAAAALERLDALATQLRADSTLPGFDLEDELGDLSSEVLMQMSHKLRFRGYRYRDIEEPFYIASYDSPRDIRVAEVYGAQEEVMVECTALYSCTVNGYMFHSEAAALPEESAIHVTDWNWNEHYAEVEFTENVEVRFLLRLAETEAEENDGEREYSVLSVEVLEAILDED